MKFSLSRSTGTKSKSGKKFGSSGRTSWSALAFHQLTGTVTRLGRLRLPSLRPTLRLQRARPHHLNHRRHLVLRLLGVREYVAALLRVHPRYAVSARLTLSVIAISFPEDVHGLTYSRLLCSLNAIGASGLSIVSHAFCTSTSRMALRETFLSVDLEPRVATSQTVATPYLRLVRTGMLSAGYAREQREALDRARGRRPPKE